MPGVEFGDPQQLACPSCGARTTVRVADLLRLSATCSTCGHSLREVGERMRAQVNEIASFAGVAETLFIFEGKYGFETDDDELRRLETPRELIAYITRMASPRTVDTDEVLAALAQRLKRQLDRSHLDTPLVELVPDALADRE